MFFNKDKEEFEQQQHGRWNIFKKSETTFVRTTVQTFFLKDCFFLSMLLNLCLMHQI